MEAEREHRVGAYVVWRAMDRLALLGRLPYNFKELTETPAGEAGITNHEQGLGDAELLGIPTVLVVGRGLKDGLLELRDRRSGDSRDIERDEVVEQVRAELTREQTPAAASRVH